MKKYFRIIKCCTAKRRASCHGRRMNAIRVAALTMIMLLLALTMTGCGEKKPNDAPTVVTPSAQATFYIDETPNAEATFRRATLYYLSDEGYIVPVSKLIPWEEGIAKACLSYITSNDVNDDAASALGLNTVIPEGVTLSLAIESDGNALLDLQGLGELESAEKERALVVAAVNTLTEFPTIASVTLLKDGQQGATLTHGTTLPTRQGAYALNVENADVATSGSTNALRLYFPTASGAYTVPVTRYIDANPTLYSCVSALIEGTSLSNLRSCFPAGTLLLGATLENGIVTVNLSDDFMAVADTYGLYSLAYESLWLTIAETNSFDRLILQVNGAVFSPETPNIPMYINGL